MDSQIKVSKKTVVNLHELTAKVLKELKRAQKEEKRDLEEIQKSLHQYQSASTAEIHIAQSTITKLLNITYQIIQGDNYKTTILVMDALTPLIESTILHAILISAINNGYDKLYKNNITFLLDVNYKAFQSFGTKYIATFSNFVKNVLLFSDDVHMSELDVLKVRLYEMYLGGLLPDMSLIAFFIKVISNKYQAESSMKQIPIGYTELEQEAPESCYFQDYKSVIFHLEDRLLDNLLNSVQCRVVQIQTPQQQTQQCNFVCDLFYYILEYLPTYAIFDIKLSAIFLSLYQKCIHVVLQLQNMALVQKLLHLLELFIKLFLPNLSNITLFNHFNNFCLRVLLTKEIPYFYLKSEVVQHLMRIFSGDQIENIFQDADVIKSKMPMVWIEPMKGLGLDKEAQQQYAQLLCRKYMPPGFLLAILYINFDSHKVQPNLVQNIFKTICQITKDQKFQPPQDEAALFLPSIYTRKYYDKLKEAIKLMKDLHQNCTSEQLSDFNQFVQFCGFIDNQIICSDDDRIFQNIFKDNKYTRYKIMSYSAGNIYCLARCLDALARINIIIDKHPQFQVDFGIPIETDFVIRTQTIQLKMKMAEVFELFNESPLKAIAKFRKMYDDAGEPFILELKKRQEDEAIEFQSEELENHYNTLCSLEVVEPRKRKPTFEENFSYYLTDVVNHLKGFSNGASVYINVIDFIQKYIKHSEYSFGISQVGFGELLGGNKPENLCCLYYYTMWYEKKYISGNKDIPFVKSLRLFLQCFKLPGEAQVIDRILRMFASIYCKISGIAHKVCHALAYATIMLNTDQHNSSVGGRMTVDVFIRNTKLIDYTNQLTSEFLTQIYEEIQITPFTLGSIEEIKCLMNIKDKYIDVKEKKTEQGQENQTPAPQSDNIEDIKTMAKGARLAAAMYEWYQYGQTDFNQNIIDTEVLFYQFNQQILGLLMQQIGFESVQNMVDVLKGSEWRPILIKTFSQLLYLYLNQNTKLPTTVFSQNTTYSKQFIIYYIQASQITDISILFRTQFNNSKDCMKEMIINQDQFKNGKFVDWNSRDKVPKLSNNSTNLVSILVELTDVYVTQNLAKKSLRGQRTIDLPLSKYYGSITFDKVWELILEVISRIQYFDILTQKIFVPIQGSNRKQLEKTGVQKDTSQQSKSMSIEQLSNQLSNLFILDMDNVLGQEIAGQVHPIVSTTFKNNTVAMYLFLQFDIMGQSYSQIYVKATDLEWQIQFQFGSALSGVSQIESRIYFFANYCHFSSCHLRNIYQQLLSSKDQLDLDHFDELYRTTNMHFMDLCIHVNSGVAQTTIESLNQIITDFVLLGNGSKNMLDEEKEVYSQLLQPITISLNQMEILRVSLLTNVVSLFTSLFVFISVNDELCTNIIKEIQSEDVQASQYVLNIDKTIEASKISKSIINQIFVTFKSMMEQLGKLTVEYLELLRADGKPIEIDPSSSILTRAKQIEMKFKEYSELCKSITESYKEAEKKVFILLLSVVNDQLLFSDTNYQIASLFLESLSKFRNFPFFASNIDESTQLIIQFVEHYILLMVRTADCQDDVKSNSNQVQFSKQISKTLNEICWDRRCENRLRYKQMVQSLMNKLLSIKTVSDKQKEMLKMILIAIFQQFTDIYCEEKLKLINQNELKCNNIEGGNFICQKCNNTVLSQKEADEIFMHCNIEVFLPLLLLESNNIDLKSLIVEQSFLNMLKSINFSRHDSYSSILAYFVKHFEKLHPSFQQMLADELPTQYHAQYIPLSQAFLLCSSGSVKEQHFRVTCSYLIKNTENQTILHQNFKMLITQMFRDFSDKKVPASTAPDFVKLIVHIISLLNSQKSMYYDNVLFAFILEQFLLYDYDLYEEFFKKATYESLISTIANESSEVRQIIVKIFKLRYPL